LLQQRNVRVLAVQNPLRSLAEDVDAVTRVLNQRSGWVVLVGHDYGGTVITQAGNHPAVAALVYVAAFAPAAGESTADLQSDYPPQARVQVDSGGFLYLTPESVAQLLAQDLPAADVHVLAAAQKPIRASALFDQVAEAAWKTKPCWYLLTSDDRMITPALQHQLAARMNARVCPLNAGHTPFLSKAKQTADVILDVVNSMRGKLNSRRLIVEPDRDG
jgi:pimeloyl-ACP methyl ester carboxylesterase